MAEQPVHHQQHGSGLGGSQFGDTRLTKIFVGGLAWETQRDTMRAYFEQFGDILEAVVITDKNTGRSKGYGFVTFKDPESARRACENPTPVIDGRRANCNLAALGVRPRFPGGFQGPRLRHFAPLIGTAQIASSSDQQQQQQHQQQQQVPFAYHQAAAAAGGFSYAPYGYTYVHEYPYPSLYNPYGNPQLSAAVYGGGGANTSGGGAAGGSGLTSPGSNTAGGSGGAMYTYSAAFNPAAAAAAAVATYPMSSPTYAVPQLLQYQPSSGLASPYVPTMLPVQQQPSASSPSPQSQQQSLSPSPSSSSPQQASNAPAGLMTTTVVPTTNTTTAASATTVTTTTTTSS